MTRVRLTDEDLVVRSQSGDRLALDALCRRYERLATGRALPFSFPGAEKADVQQEARIGLLKAVRSWRPDSGTPFALFAPLVIDRRIITALKTSQRGKHRSLTESARIGYSDTGEPIEILDLLPSPMCLDPLLIVIAKERLFGLILAVRRLSMLERHSLLGIASGATYSALSAAVGRSPKAIDNAAQRAREKLAEAA